jgi:hypothetical protein
MKSKSPNSNDLIRYGEPMVHPERTEWLKSLGLTDLLIHRNHLLTLPEEGFKVILNDVLRAKGRIGRPKHPMNDSKGLKGRKNAI